MRLYARGGKRIVDFVAAALIAVFTAPIHVLCAAAVGVTSGRPVYFAQERVGRGGKVFKLIKFRTMKVGTHEASGGYPTAAMVTPVGRVLRKTSLDELPQLLNIIKGDMSLVGPRPALPEQAHRYSAPQRGRLIVRPGLTGLAQVRYRNNAAWSVRIESDLEYVRTITLWTDVKLLVMTVPAVVTGGSVKIGQSPSEVDDLGVLEASDD
jgi:lipopolysaccharide/colanic/teichoic acid biosynthesis glycosyltransferase